MSWFASCTHYYNCVISHPGTLRRLLYFSFRGRTLKHIDGMYTNKARSSYKHLKSCILLPFFKIDAKHLWLQIWGKVPSKHDPCLAVPGSGLMIQNYRLRRVHIVTVSKQSKHPQNTHFIERTSYNACPQPAHSSWDSSIKNVKFSVYGQFGKKEWTGCEPSRCVLWLLMNVNTQRTIY